MEPYRVPTSGRFYLHDDRTADKPADDVEDEEQDESQRDGAQAVPASRRKAAQEGADRWKHDRFDQAQTPLLLPPWAHTLAPRHYFPQLYTGTCNFCCYDSVP
jgi:hypothetical protein